MDNLWVQVFAMGEWFIWWLARY